ARKIPRRERARVGSQDGGGGSRVPRGSRGKGRVSRGADRGSAGSSAQTRGEGLAEIVVVLGVLQPNVDVHTSAKLLKPHLLLALGRVEESPLHHVVFDLLVRWYLRLLATELHHQDRLLSCGIAKHDGARDLAWLQGRHHLLELRQKRVERERPVRPASA